MTLKRLHVPGESIRNGNAVLTRDQAHYLKHVLRLRSGDHVEIFDGEGSGYAGTLRVRGAEVSVETLSLLPGCADDERPLILAQALIKSDKFEWVLQKATELGVDRIIPLETRYCEVRIPKGRLESRIERWRRIALEASRQSRRFRVPEISAPLSLPELFSLEEISCFKGLFLFENARERWHGTIGDAPGFVLCIGPEGGWHSDEADAATAAGFHLFNLGQRILRAETAALAAVTLVRFSAGGLWIAD